MLKFVTFKYQNGYSDVLDLTIELIETNYNNNVKNIIFNRLYEKILKDKYNSISEVPKYNCFTEDDHYKFCFNTIITSDYVKFYKVESALALASTFITYNRVPVTYIWKHNDNRSLDYKKILKLMYDVEELNSTDTYSNHLLDIKNIERYNEPVITITGYTSTLKEVYSDGEYVEVGDGDFNKFPDVYTYVGNTKDNVMVLERAINSGIIKVKPKLLEDFIKFERARQTYVSESHKHRHH